MDDGSVTTKPGCESEGEKTFSCENEGCDHKTTETVPATGHTFNEYLPNGDATCEQDGTKTATCPDCGAKDTVADPSSRVDHDYDDGKCVFCGEKDPSAPSGRVWWIVGISLLALIIAGLIIFFLFFYKKDEDDEDEAAA